MSVIAITGGIGQGKTMYMSYLANKIAREKECSIYANYGLKNAKEAFLAIEEGSVIAIDEAQQSNIIFENYNENTLIIAVTNLKFIKLPKEAEIINVERKGNNILASNGDEISIDEHFNLYDVLKIAYPCRM